MGNFPYGDRHFHMVIPLRKPKKCQFGDSLLPKRVCDHTGINMYVAMLLAQTLLKLEDGAANMATRSQLAVWMDAVIRALRVDCAKDTEPIVVAMSSIVRITYSDTICANFIIL